MSASASVFTLTPLTFQVGLPCLLKPALGVDLALPTGVNRLGWLKHRGLNWDPYRAQLDR